MKRNSTETPDDRSAATAQARERAEAIVRSAMANMALEGQALPPEAYDRLYARALKNELNRARHS